MANYIMYRKARVCVSIITLVIERPDQAEQGNKQTTVKESITEIKSQARTLDRYPKK
jgi:hypothetical protein